MMFGNKKRIADLETEIARQDATILQCAIDLKANMGLKRETDALRNQVEYLARTIRQMDDQIFQMSQMVSWPQMRPYFVTLCDGMTARKVTESNRIADILRPELIETYKPKDEVKAELLQDRCGRAN